MTEENYLERQARLEKIISSFPDQEALPKKPWLLNRIQSNETLYYGDEGAGAPSGEDYNLWLNDCMEFIQSPKAFERLRPE